MFYFSKTQFTITIDIKMGTYYILGIDSLVPLNLPVSADQSS